MIWFLIPVFTNAQMATQTFVTDLQAMNPTVVQVQVGTMLHRIILRVMIEDVIVYPGLHANIWLIWSPWFVYLACVIILSSFPQGTSKSSSTSQSQNGQTQKTTIIQPSQTHSGQQFIVTSKACYSNLAISVSWF